MPFKPGNIKSSRHRVAIAAVQFQQPQPFLCILRANADNARFQFAQGLQQPFADQGVILDGKQL